MTLAEARTILDGYADNHLSGVNKTTFKSAVSLIADGESSQSAMNAAQVTINSFVELQSDTAVFDAGDKFAETVNPNSPNYPNRPH